MAADKSETNRYGNQTALEPCEKLSTTLKGRHSNENLRESEVEGGRLPPGEVTLIQMSKVGPPVGTDGETDLGQTRLENLGWRLIMFSGGATGLSQVSQGF